MEFKPLPGHVLVEVDVPLPSKVIITPELPPPPSLVIGKVVTLGTRVVDPDIRVGAHVLFAPHSATVLKGLDNLTPVMTVDAKQILAIGEQ